MINADETRRREGEGDYEYRNRMEILQETQRNKEARRWMTRISLTATGIILALTTVSLVGCPNYNVYAQRMKGKAVLAEAQSSRMVAIQTAKAKFESSDYEARAEVRRAEGVAQANKIIGDSLKNNEGYLRYLYINNLENSKGQVIYIPTEAGLPILEAGRRPAAKAE